MFTIEGRINGTLIWVCYGHNKGIASVAGYKKTLCEYDYEFHHIGAGKPTETGSVKYVRENGLTNLFLMILADIEDHN